MPVLQDEPSLGISRDEGTSDREMLAEGSARLDIVTMKSSPGCRTEINPDLESNRRLELADLGRISELFTPHIQRVDHHLKRAAADAWGRRRLNTGGVASLSYIVANPGISQSEIVRRLGFDKSAVNSIVNSLEDFGWVDRRPSPDDRRRNALFATAEGQLALNKMIERLKSIEEEILSDMSEKNYKMLVKLLSDLHRMCLSAGY